MHRRPIDDGPGRSSRQAYRRSLDANPPPLLEEGEQPAEPRPLATSAADAQRAAAQLLGARTGSMPAAPQRHVRWLYDDLLEGVDGNRRMAQNLMEVARETAQRRRSIEMVTTSVAGYSVVGHLRACMVHLGAAIRAMESGETDLGERHLRIADSHRARANRRNSLPGR